MALMARSATMRVCPALPVTRSCPRRSLAVHAKATGTAPGAPLTTKTVKLAAPAALVSAAVMPLLSAGAALAEEAQGGADIGQYVVALSPAILYVLYRTFLSDDRTATASHILVKDEAVCADLKAQLAASGNLKGDFAALASEYSTCPSKARGGSLGTFRPGQMVPAFDAIAFDEAVGMVHGPVKTDFGYHLVLVESRTNHKTKETETA